MSTNPLTARQRSMLAAIRAGHTTFRAIGAFAGISSTSVVKTQLDQLADAGHIILEPSGDNTLARVYDGRDFCAAWNAAAALAGNPEA